MLGVGCASAVKTIVMSEQTESFWPIRLQRVPLSLFLAGAIGLAMLIAMGLMIWLTLGTARDNTSRLLSDKAQLVLTLVTERTSQFLEPAERLTEEIANRIEQGVIDPSDEAELVQALGYGLAGVPQINAAVFVDPDGWLLSVFRVDDEGNTDFDRGAWEDDPAVAAAIEQLSSADVPTAGWGQPLFVADAETTLVGFAQPMSLGDRGIGFVIATTTVELLSTFIASIETPGEIGTFVLYDRDHVLAHSALAEPGRLTSLEQPLPSLAELGDPALGLIWADGWEDRRIPDFSVDAHWVDGPEHDYVYLYDDLSGAHDVPWTVGGYFRAQDIAGEWRRVNQVTAIALGLLALSLLGAALLGRRLAKPATEIAETARAVATLKLDHIQPLQGSRIRELDDAERSLNAMITALGCFVRYLPRDLVDYVLRYPERDVGRPRLRPMTIMFTDISGFTTLSETLDPEVTGRLLNQHFADLEGCIRATGGVIDKYMGDGLLAFWGAPEPMGDHQKRAIDAALAIACTVRARNRETELPLRVRIGIASGEILVGDLGAPTRTNYTVIGDPVNLAQRLLQTGHVAAPDHTTVIIATEACIMAIKPKDRPATRALGEHRVRGRHGLVELVEVIDSTSTETTAEAAAAVTAVAE